MSELAVAGFEQVAQGYYLEALLIVGEDIWFSDVVQGGVRKVGSPDVLLPDRTMIGGLQMNEDGSVLVSGAGGIDWAHPSAGTSGTLVAGLDGVNEMCGDRHGGMYFGTTDLASILRGERPGPSSIQHLATDFTLRTVREGLTFANGLTVSADRSVLYFNESFSATRSFPIGTDGVLAEPATLIDMADCDGMALDVDGNIWVTGFASGELRCVRPSGTEVRRLSLPGQACTNVRFGGGDMRDLYVTIVDPSSAQALAKGTPLTEQNSGIFRTRSPVAGARHEQTRFRLAA